MARNDVEVRVGQPERPAARPLLPSAARRPAIVGLAACVLVTAFLGVLFAHQSQPSWLDAVIDARVRAGLGGHQALLKRVTLLGTLGPMVVMATALILACLVTRRWRGALLAAVAVPAAEVITEFLLKPLVGRTLSGYLVFPSGHTTGVFVLAAVVTVLLTGPLRPRMPTAVRGLLVLAAFVAASATATAMIALGFHYFTDTVGGAAVAVGTALATALTLDKLSGMHGQRAADAEIARADG
jgi:membrane-associated phospholipid phosphatase